jgi:hypothetical protein
VVVVSVLSSHVLVLVSAVTMQARRPTSREAVPVELDDRPLGWRPPAW